MHQMKVDATIDKERNKTKTKTPTCIINLILAFVLLGALVKFLIKSIIGEKMKLHKVKNTQTFETFACSKKNFLTFCISLGQRKLNTLNEVGIKMHQKGKISVIRSNSILKTSL